jgi:hypothetical protein
MIQLAHQEMTKLELALEEACRSMPHGGDHRLRKQVARKLLDSALKGNTTLGGLTDVARAAFADATKNSARQQPCRIERRPQARD